MSLSNSIRLGLGCALLTFSGLSDVALAQPATEPATAAMDVRSELGNLVQAWAQAEEFSGNVLIARGSDTLYDGAFGLADIDANQPVDEHTAYLIASLSKTFTAVLVLQAVEAGQLSLDDPISTHLPEFQAPYADRVTVRHMLQNRTGIPHYVDLPGWFSQNGANRYSQDVLLDTLADMPLRFEPGSEYYYSNANYYLLGLILDQVGGASYEDQLSARILSPLGLMQTGQIYDMPEGASLAVNYLREDDSALSVIEISNPSVFRATASLYAPATDILTWGQAMLGEDMLTPQSRAVMFDPEHPMAWTIAHIPVEGSEEALELRLYSGRIAGHSSLLALIPDTQDVIMLIGNNSVGYNALAGLTVEITTLLQSHPG